MYTSAVIAPSIFIQLCNFTRKQCKERKERYFYKQENRKAVDLKRTKFIKSKKNMTQTSLFIVLRVEGNPKVTAAEVAWLVKDRQHILNWIEEKKADYF